MVSEDLENICNWSHATGLNWSFNPDPTKMTKEVLFSRKNLKVIPINLTFIGKHVHSSNFQKHLSPVLDSKLNFDMHIKDIKKSEILYT